MQFHQFFIDRKEGNWDFEHWITWTRWNLHNLLLNEINSTSPPSEHHYCQSSQAFPKLIYEISKFPMSLVLLNFTFLFSTVANLLRINSKIYMTIWMHVNWHHIHALSGQLVVCSINQNNMQMLRVSDLAMGYVFSLQTTSVKK